MPLRQFVLTVPFELRARLAFDRDLIGVVGRLFVDTVLRWYARMLGARGVAGGQSGAITVVQRVSSDLRANPHYHAILLDGVFAPDDGGALHFHPLPSLSNGELCDLMQVICARVIGWLTRHGVIDEGSELGVIDGELAEREPALSALARASVGGLAPAGPERRKRLPVALDGVAGVEVKGGLNVAELGFSLHAATVVGAGDRGGRQALCKYVLRPPIAQERVKLLPDGLVRLELRRAFRDGTVAIDLDPLSLLCRLAASVPSPRMHVARFAGVLSAAHKWRSRVVPPPPAEDATDAPHGHERSERPTTHRSGYWSWAKLVKRSLGIEADRCEICGATMKLRALVTRAQSIERYLQHIAESTEVLPLAPARDPPFFKSRAVRRKLGELDVLQQRGQLEMFGA